MLDEVRKVGIHRQIVSLYRGKDLAVPSEKLVSDLNHSPVWREFSEKLVAQVLECAGRRMHRAVKVEVNVPLLGRPILVNEMQDCTGSAPLVKTTRRSLVIGH